MPVFQTIKEAKRYGEKHCFTADIKQKYSEKHGNFLGYEVNDLYDEKVTR